VPWWGTYGFVAGPVLALGVVGVLSLILRWAFARGGSVVGRPPRRGAPGEYGMLVPVSTPVDQAQADRVVAYLADRGVRAISVPTTEGLRTMVFRDDELKAHNLLTLGRGRPEAHGP